MEEKKLTGYPSIDKPWLKYYTEEQINAPLPHMTAYDYLRQQNEGPSICRPWTVASAAIPTASCSI